MANYSAVILSTALAESKEKHTPSVRMQLHATTRLETEEEVDKNFIADLWLSDKAVERTIKLLRDLGFQGSSMADLNYPEAMQGLLCEISTEMVEYNGETSEKVKFINKPGSFANRGLKAASDDIVKSIAQRYDAALRSGKYHKQAQQQAAYGRAQVSKPNPYAPKTQSAVQEEAGDDLPF